MSIRRLLQSPRARRGIAASAIVLSLGGLVLFRAPAGADLGGTTTVDFRNGTTFSGPGARGSLSLSHGKVLADDRQRVFAELRLRADQVGEDARERAPLSMVVVLDTSGSMSGEKISEAQRSVIRLLQQMRHDDEVALVRYDSHAQIIQPMARVSDIRSSLIAEVHELRAGGGTNIPAALRSGMSALESASSGRVKRLVLVSDGLDDTRSESESLARNGTDRGITVSSLGIGLDFDEGYMSSVARAGRGNFGFVENVTALARFLERELSETASTTIENAVARLELPEDMTFVRAIGADVSTRGSDDERIELRLGSLFAGDERRVVIELETDADYGDSLSIESEIRWSQVGGERASIDLKDLTIVTTDDAEQVADARDPGVYGACMSALASLRQLEAAQAYAQGDTKRAKRIIDQNMADLEEAAEAAPEAVATSLDKQAASYRKTKGAFDHAAPASPAGRSAAKRATADESANLGRQAY